MENINLTENEKKELEKRGFYVKKNFSFKDLIVTTYQLFIYLFTLGGGGIIGMMPIGFLIILTEWSTILSTITLIIVGIYLIGLLGAMCYGIIAFITDFIKSGASFHSAHGVISFGRSSNSQVAGHKGGILYLRKYYKKITNIQLQDSREEAIVTVIFISFFIFFVSFQNTIIQAGLLEKEIAILWIIVNILIIWIAILIIGRFMFQSLNPLYAFGNIGMNIQKLTPEIESQSKFIQAGFQKDMNFSILHSGFEELSVIFSRIVELVLKLEKIEKRANKGNLFDSVKYIDSLRTDIMTPLIELKVFLEKQRGVLLESQQELGRVMVGVSSELGGNVTLSSERGRILIQELDESIGKLDGMIGKMGQKP